MGAIVVDDDVQLLGPRVAGPHPFQEWQKLRPALAGGEATVEPVGFQIVEGQEVPHATLATISGTQATDRFAWSFVAVAVAGLQVERTELVDAQAPAGGGPMAVQPPNGPVFLGKQRVGRFLPGLGPPQPDLVATEDFPQPTDTDVGDD